VLPHVVVVAAAGRCPADAADAAADVDAAAADCPSHRIMGQRLEPSLLLMSLC